MPRALPLLFVALLAGCAATGGLTAWERQQLERRERALAASGARVSDAGTIARIARLLARIEPAPALRIHVLEHPAPQAEVLGGEVLVVRTGLLDAAPRDDELAFVLAHELAHAVLGHVAARRARDWDAAAAERAADAWALDRTLRLGFDPAAAASLLHRLAQRLEGADRASVEARAAALAQGRAF